MKFLFSIVLLLGVTVLKSQEVVKLEELPNHIGDSVKVKGKIFGVRFMQSSKNSPTFINLGASYPNQLLTVVIWGNVREKLGYIPEDKKFQEGMAIVTGKVAMYKDNPQIVITDPKQLQMLYDEEVPASQLPAIEHN